MSKQKTFRNTALVAFLGIYVTTQAASAQPGGVERGERRGPPPEAFEACAELASGDRCEMTGRQGETLQGSCIVPRDGEDSLVCLPDGGPHGGPHGGLDSGNEGERE